MQGASLFCSLSLRILATTARPAENQLDSQLAEPLSSAGFSGTAGSNIEARLGGPIDDRLADLGPYSQHAMSALGAARDC